MNRFLKTALFTVTLLLVLVCLADTASACPTCKDGMAGDPAYSGMVKGYFWSILFMMSMPFLVLGTVSAYFYYEVRRARARKVAAAQESRPSNPRDHATHRDHDGADVALQS